VSNKQAKNLHFFLLFKKTAKNLKLFAHVLKVLKHTTYPTAICPFNFTLVFISLAKTTSVLSTRVFTNIKKWRPSILGPPCLFFLLSLPCVNSLQLSTIRRFSLAFLYVGRNIAGSFLNLNFPYSLTTRIKALGVYYDPQQREENSQNKPGLQLQ
jgi:hypothetical protein